LDRHKQWLIESIAAEPDLTLEEIRGATIDARGHGDHRGFTRVYFTV
jgi:hypothetical protein